MHTHIKTSARTHLLTCMRTQSTRTCMSLVLLLPPAVLAAIACRLLSARLLMPVRGRGMLCESLFCCWNMPRGAVCMENWPSDVRCEMMPAARAKHRSTLSVHKTVHWSLSLHVHILMRVHTKHVNVAGSGPERGHKSETREGPGQKGKTCMEDGHGVVSPGKGRLMRVQLEHASHTHVSMLLRNVPADAPAAAPAASSAPAGLNIPVGLGRLTLTPMPTPGSGMLVAPSWCVYRPDMWPKLFCRGSASWYRLT